MNIRATALSRAAGKSFFQAGISCVAILYEVILFFGRLRHLFRRVARKDKPARTYVSRSQGLRAKQPKARNKRSNLPGRYRCGRQLVLPRIAARAAEEWTGSRVGAKMSRTHGIGDK